MENNTIRVNALPTLTWHRLHVNACKTEPYTPVKPCTVQTVSENGVAAVSALEPCTDCGAVETGVGRNVDNLFRWGMTVTEKTETNITFDANHEMAGKELNFQIELVEVK